MQPFLNTARHWLRRHPGLHRSLRQGMLQLQRHAPWTERLLDTLRPGGVTIPAAEYQRWIDQVEGPADAMRQRLQAAVRHMRNPPLISVVMPAYNTPERFLREAIASLQAQIYPHWELCVADDASPEPQVSHVLREMAAADPRIRFVRRPANGHISAASNTALDLARGEFVALMDHDDLLPPHALAAVAHHVQAAPELQVLFSDEDKVDDRGRRSEPHFKPGWNAELLLSQNLVSHLGVYRRALLRRIGGFREGFEGSQDWDMALRATAGLRPEQVRHIPLVLYHWRQGTGAASFSESALERCAAAGRRAVSEHLARRGETGARPLPQPDLPGWSRIVHPLPARPFRLSVVLTAPSPLPEKLREILRLPGSDGTEILSAGPEGPLGAARQASGEMLLFLDPALRPDHPEWLAELLAQAWRPGVGAAGPLVMDARNRAMEAGLVVEGERAWPVPYLAGLRYPAQGYHGQLRLPRQVSAVGAGCLAVRRAAFEALSLPAEADQWHLALCEGLRQSGQRIVWTPLARLRHSGRMPELCAGPASPRDPYFNPNLSAARPGLHLAEGPGQLAALIEAMQAAR
ncbi:glycosyltransferase family 2 protein [Teichococcus oryzae]|uniref:glycosyltransferase family 2 protein n=1 Tax=Teichococcus oryzae TaxID=1608942 RepID=UPI0013763579|nr:glycosyltransferase [Pseudoroseomonas oryzae]